jgi:putative ABC transport system ATP-binding protein
MNQSLLVVDNLRKVYRTGGGEVEALKALTLEVRAGELVGVMGPSGSGKTTLLNCVSGLDDIDGGHVFVEGRDLFAMSDAERTEHRAHRRDAGTCRAGPSHRPSPQRDVRR